MLIEEITVNNWRGYREPHTFRFTEGFNILVGRNEAGKSALFEALTRAFFDRHTGKSEEIKRAQPLDSTLSPEVTVVLRANSRRYKVFKRFIENPTAQLYSERGGTWELDHDGDQADAQVRELLRGEAFGRAVKPEHRGLAQALWYLQRDSPLPESTWNEAVHEGLPGFVKLVAGSPEEKRIVSQAETTYQQYYSPTGRLKNSSELVTLQDTISQVQTKLSGLKSTSDAVEKHRQDLEELESQRVDKTQQLDEARRELGELVKLVEKAEAFDAEKKSLEHSKESKEQSLAALRSDSEAIERRVKKVAGLQGQLDNSKKGRVQTEMDAERERLAAERYRAKWKKELEPGLKTVETEFDALQALWRLRELQENEGTLRGHLGKVASAKKNLEIGQKRLLRLHAPSSTEWDQFEEITGQFHDVKIQADASAIHVGFDLEAAQTKITAEPAPQSTPSKNEYLVTAPTTFSIHEVGRVKVWGGGEPLEELSAKASDLKENIEATLARFGVKNEQALGNLHRSKVESEAQVKKLEKEYKKILSEGPKDVEAKLLQIQGAIEEERGKSKGLPKAIDKLSSSQIKHRLGELQTSKKQLIRAIEEEQGNEQSARTKHDELVKEGGNLSVSAADFQSQIASANEENAETLKQYGTTRHLEHLVKDAEKAKEEAHKALANLLGEYETRVEIPRRSYQQTERRAKDFEKQLDKIREDSVDRMARIEEATDQGFYSQMSDMEAELGVLSRRHETLEMHAKAAKLLYEMIRAYQKEQSVALAGPVADLVNRWLCTLTDESYKSLALNENLIPVALQSSRYAQSLPLESVSYGTSEQVIVLLRLAIGVLSSRDERGLVVIDDRLVNADPIRAKRLGLIIQEASTSCQIIMATCNDTPYVGIDANTIRVPHDGKIAA